MNTFEEIFRSDVIWSYLPVSEHPENEFKEIRNDFSLNGKNINYIGHGDKHWKIIQLGHYIFWLAKDRCMDRPCIMHPQGAILHMNEEKWSNINHASMSLINGYTISGDALPYLYDGCISVENERYCNIKLIGTGWGLKSPGNTLETVSVRVRGRVHGNLVQ